MNATIPAIIGRPARERSPVAQPSIRLDFEEGKVAVIHFDRPESSANILDTKSLRLLSDIIDDLAAIRSLRGVIFYSDKPSVFIAGADVKELSSIQDPESLVDLGQQTFSKIAALNCVTVAAIHGACAGGGLELALACDYRLASRDRATRLGLPEVNLGLIPAWGGSTRLPRLLGLARALRMILRGELMPARKAAKLGLVDALAPRERLLTLAMSYVSKGKKFRLNYRKLLAMPVAPLVEFLALRSVLFKTRGHYPATRAAINVVVRSVFRNASKSLAAEKQAILALANTDTCRNLIRVFFLQERARHGPTSKARPIKKTAVIGAGLMGAGIAQWLASRGLEVLLRDVSSEPLAHGLKQAQKLFSDARKRGLFTETEVQAGMDRIVPSDVPVDMKQADLVIEAAVERMDLKKHIFADIEARTRYDTILATNTSALSISEISLGMHHPERVIGLHFFNPVHHMQLVEVVRGRESSQAAMDAAAAFVRQIGKLPVVVRDSPGFLVNRILLPYLLEASHLFEEGADIEALDESMLDFGMPMGPMRLLDEVGLDVATDVAKTLCAAFSERMQMPSSLGHLSEIGMKGRKCGQGFFVYRKGQPTAINRKVLKCRQSREKARLDREELQRRMVLLMINEAARCLEERVVEEARDIDFAMIMGTGFAPFRGGPLRLADTIGLKNVSKELRQLFGSGERQFVPCELLLEMVERNRRFYGS